MKNMKKTISLVLILSILLSIPAFAQTGIVGQIYSTDILTYVNGKPIQGYNIGGRTVVIAEDLIGYGFSVHWDESLRELKIESDFDKGNVNPAPVARDKVGQILGNVYKTDIKTYYNGIFIEGYNIGGRTAVCLEDLGDITNSPNAPYGYSDYLGKAVWDEENRIISYTSFLDNSQSIMGIFGVSLSFSDNIISVTAEIDSSDIQNNSGIQVSYSSGTGMSKYNLHPLYFDYHGELTEIGCAVCHPVHMGDFVLMHIENPEEVLKMIQTFLVP